MHQATIIQRLARATFWAALLFAFVMATLPHPPQVMGTMWDKAQHMIAFAVLTALACIAFATTRTRTILLWLAGFGALIEFVQAIPALHRDSDIHDWAADLIAISLVLLLRLAIKRFVLPAGRRA